MSASFSKYSTARAFDEVVSLYPKPRAKQPAAASWTV